jgi:hypothetical protein
VFQFSVKPDVAARMKVGQDVYANFITRQVSLDGIGPCCNIVNLAAPGTSGSVNGTATPIGPIDSAAPASPCCGLVSVDARTGTATALDRASGRTFQFSIQGAAAAKLKAGDAVYANFAAGNVSVDGITPCCGITQAAAPVGPIDGNRGNVKGTATPASPIDSAAPATPCCSVVSVNARTGTATALNKASGRTFQFKIQGAAASRLKAGDAIYANFAAGKVSVDGATPCCNITQ